jgi:hypothetical protein
MTIALLQTHHLRRRSGGGKWSIIIKFTISLMLRATRTVRGLEENPEYKEVNGEDMVSAPNTEQAREKLNGTVRPYERYYAVHWTSKHIVRLW